MVLGMGRNLQQNQADGKEAERKMSMIKIIEFINDLGSIVTDIPKFMAEILNGITDVLEAENDLARLTSRGFVDALKPTLKELSSWTPRPYKGYLEEAKDMILQGNGEFYTLEHFDIELLKAKGRIRI